MAVIKQERVKSELNKLQNADRPAHSWYRFVLSFPPHLVRDYLNRFGISRKHTVLDPFCGTGTTLVECKKLGIPSIGIEANPMAALASKVKTDWVPNARQLLSHAQSLAEKTLDELSEQGIEDEVLPLLRGGAPSKRTHKWLRSAKIAVGKRKSVAYQLH